MSLSEATETWPDLPLDSWRETCSTLHLWTQIVGKIRLARSPWQNHSWHVTLYVTPTGLTTSPIPHDDQIFQIDLNFVHHRLEITSSRGTSAALKLRAQSVASFYREVMEQLDQLGLPVRIHRMPNEVADPIRFDLDEQHSSYDPDFANRFWRVLLQTDRVFKEFRVRFSGKCSPVHYFWGAPDLAVTRFSGRKAPTHPGGIPNLPDWITREAYSHEVHSCGFWPGSDIFPHPAFYAYAYPEPEGFSKARIQPDDSFYSQDLREFILPYDAVRTAASPGDALLNFLQDTYTAAAELGDWDRRSLELEIEPRQESQVRQSE